MPPLSIPTNFADGLDCMCFFLTVSCFRLTVFHVCAYRQMSTSHSETSKGADAGSPSARSKPLPEGWRGYYHDGELRYYHKASNLWLPTGEEPSSQSPPPPPPPKGPALSASQRASLSAALSARQARLQQDAAASRSGPGSIPAPSGMPPPPMPRPNTSLAGAAAAAAGLAATARRQAVEATGDAARAFQTYADHDLQKLEKEIDAKKAKGQVVSAAEYKLLAELVVRRLCPLRLPPPPPSPMPLGARRRRHTHRSAEPTPNQDVPSTAPLTRHSPARARDGRNSIFLSFYLRFIFVNSFCTAILPLLPAFP